MASSNSGRRHSRAADASRFASTGAYRIGLWAIAAAVMLSPLLWARVPPLVDYPNHLARMWILTHHTRIAALAANYTVDWRILPDLGMDVVVCGLSQIMPVERAGRLFVALTMLMLVAGTLTLHRVLHGRWQTWPLCSVLFVYNAALFWGFVSCLFATGAALLAFSGWVASARWRPGPRLAVFAAVAALLVLLHLFAFGLYALTVAAYELGRRWEHRRVSLASVFGWASMMLQLVPGLMLWRLSLAHGGPTLTRYGGLPAKIYAAFSPFAFALQPAAFDFLLAAAISLALAVAVATRSLKLVPAMRLPIAAMIAAALLMPHRTSGALFADIRLPVALPFLVIAATRLEIAHRAAVRMLAAGAVALFGLRIWSVSQSWHDYDRWFGEFRSASAVITPGARLLVVEAPGRNTEDRLPHVPAFFATLQPVTFIHMGALAVIDRSVFFPYLFTGWTTVDIAPINRAISEAEARPATPDQIKESADLVPRAGALRDVDGRLPYWRDWTRTFDYALWIDFGATPKPQSRWLRPLVGGSFFEIFRVVGSRDRLPQREDPTASFRSFR